MVVAGRSLPWLHYHSGGRRWSCIGARGWDVAVWRGNSAYDALRFRCEEEVCSAGPSPFRVQDLDHVCVDAKEQVANEDPLWSETTGMRFTPQTYSRCSVIPAFTFLTQASELQYRVHKNYISPREKAPENAAHDGNVRCYSLGGTLCQTLCF